MILSSCEGCGRLVPCIDGQIDVLDSYYLDDGGPPRESAGDWHVACLLRSPYGPAWYEVRLRNFTMVRGNRVIATTPSWSVVEHPRTAERLAFSHQGQLLSLVYPRGRLRKVEGGSIYRHEDREHNLELEDEALIHAIQESLLATKTFPVLALVEAMGLTDVMHHPEALEGGMLHFDRGFRRRWSPRFVVARWEYGVFVPAELEEYVLTKPLPRSG